MNFFNKKEAVIGAFIGLFVALYRNPNSVKILYNSILGRLFLVILVIYFTSNNIILGLIVGLIIIISSNNLYIEGLENMNIDQSKINDAKEKISEIKDKVDPVNFKDKINVTTGIDTETIKESIKAKESNTIPIIINKSSENTEPASKESFSSMVSVF